ncbi:UBP1-associated proteins 1C-like [Neltuma alba]|uniref:UBP1-associated proteins 1C-like n=1 Tax=Neltuma alba TaxID=207710 RepID=UPI0010A38C5E|nr:UBP1-associated proteins 1C-like [Prosopis alba]
MGGGEKEQRTIPLEIAIQKELIYRRKVTSSSIQTLQQSPLSSLLSSSPCLSGTKRKELVNPHDLPLECQNPDKLYCKICELSCSSPFNLTQHLMGRKHKSKLKEQDSEHHQKKGMEGRRNQMKWCDLCKVPCMTEDLLNLHFKGKKHRAELQKFEMSKEKGGEIPSQRKWCELCKIWCIDMSAFKQHLEGKKHLFQMHIMEKNKERPDMLRPNSIRSHADEMVNEARNMDQAQYALRRSTRVREKSFKSRD